MIAVPIFCSAGNQIKTMMIANFEIDRPVRQHVSRL